jgi:serine/threonine-protein kinase RsbW
MSDLEGAAAAGAPASEATAPLVNTSFDRDTLGTLRHRVAACAARAGLLARSLHSFVLVVNELTTNAVLHGGGRGRLRLWHTGSALICEISDQGPGLSPERLAGHWLPPHSAASGRGLWLAHRLFPALSVSSGPSGTTVRLTAGLPSAGG